MGYIMTLTVKTKFDSLQYVANVRHIAFATSASSDNLAFAFYFFEAFNCLKVLYMRVFLSTRVIMHGK